MLTTLKSIMEVKTGVNLVYINYDSTDGELDIFKYVDNDYGKNLQGLCAFVGLYKIKYFFTNCKNGSLLSCF
jgi:hypothetical protein